MSHRISYERAKEIKQHELECRELNKKGIKQKVSRYEKKRLSKLSKSERFIEMLKKRKGYFEQKDKGLI